MTPIQTKSGKYRVSHTRRRVVSGFSFLVSGFKLRVVSDSRSGQITRNQKLETYRAAAPETTSMISFVIAA
jgi:hypothetical protein